jgi:hypothetical protein
MADHDDASCVLAAIRWAARLATDCRNLGLQDLAATVLALQALARARPARPTLAE